MDTEETKELYKSIGTLEGLMVGVRDDVEHIKKAIDKTIPGPLLIKIITIVFLAIFTWLGTLTTILMTK